MPWMNETARLLWIDRLLHEQQQMRLLVQATNDVPGWFDPPAKLEYAPVLVACHLLARGDPDPQELREAVGGVREVVDGVGVPVSPLLEEVRFDLDAMPTGYRVAHANKVQLVLDRHRELRAAWESTAPFRAYLEGDGDA